MKIFRLDERLVVARGRGLEAVHQGQIGAVDAHQLALPNAIVQRAWVEFREGLLGDYRAAEPLSREIVGGVSCFVVSGLCPCSGRKMCRIFVRVNGKLLTINGACLGRFLFC